LLVWLARNMHWIGHLRCVAQAITVLRDQVNQMEQPMHVLLEHIQITTISQHQGSALHAPLARPVQLELVAAKSHHSCVQRVITALLAQGIQSNIHV